jgi:hypothetical protein
LDEKEFRLDSKKYKLSVEATVNSGPKWRELAILNQSEELAAIAGAR